VEIWEVITIAQLNGDKVILEKTKKIIPSIDKIIIEAINQISGSKLSQQYIKTHFSDAIISLEKKAHTIYNGYQDKAFSYAIDEWVISNSSEILQWSKNLSPDEFARKICRQITPLAAKLEFSLGQGRKSRGGKSLERIVTKLLTKINIRCQRPKGKKERKKLKRIDVVVPDQKTALTTPDKAYFLSCKRTLRERWKQAIPEQKPSWRVFLITIDEILPEEKADEIHELGMIVYVRDELKTQTHLKKNHWVRKLSNLPKDLK